MKQTKTLEEIVRDLAPPDQDEVRQFAERLLARANREAPAQARPGQTEEGDLVFTSGETHWSADARTRLRLADAARQEGNRRRLLEALARPGPLWDPARHPELEGEGGSAAWVKRLRREAEEAFERRTRSKDGA